MHLLISSESCLLIGIIGNEQADQLEKDLASTLEPRNCSLPF